MRENRRKTVIVITILLMTVGTILGFIATIISMTN